MSLLAQIDAALARLKHPGAPPLRKDEQVRLLSEAAIALRPCEHRRSRPTADLTPALLAMVRLQRIGDPVALGRALAPQQRPTAQRGLGLTRLSQMIGAGFVQRRGPYWDVTEAGAAEAARYLDNAPEVDAA